MLKKIALGLVLLGVAVVCYGCQISYLMHCGFGHAWVLTHTVPVSKALEDSSLSPECRDKLLWVQQVRQYALDVVGLKVGKSYLSFYDTHGRPAVYNLSACRKDSFQPYTWSFPVVGKIEYLGYFDRAKAEAHARQLQKDGYDTVIYGAKAYSTIGWLADPLFSPLLDCGKPDLAETVLHELTHNTVFKPGDSGFNESVAQFVGEKGVRAFLASRGEEAAIGRQAIEAAEDRERVNEFLNGVYRDLEAFYRRTDLSSVQKIAQRDRIFLAHREVFKTKYLPRLHRPEAMKAWANLPVNNAQMVLHRRYHRDTDVFERVYRANDQDLQKTVQVFARASKASDAWQYLQEWLRQLPRS